MFIYSYYAQHGFESPQRLVKAISEMNIKQICLIDDKGMAIPSFLHSCMEREIKVSFAILFSCYVEGYEQKQDGYFITARKEGLETVMKTVEELKEKWIPFLSHSDIVELKNEGVYCFLRKEKNHKEISTGELLTIRPVYFLQNEDKEFHESVYGKQNAYAVGEIGEEPEEFIKNISSNAKDFLTFSEENEMKMDIEHLIKWSNYNKREKRQIGREIEYFRQRNEIMSLYSLYLAKEEKINFIAHGDLYKSLLAHAMGIIPEKPEFYSLTFDFDQGFEMSIVINEQKQNELFLHLKTLLQVKYPLSKYTLKPVNAVKKAEEILKEKTSVLTKLRKNETLEEFMKRMRVYLLTNDKERKVVEFASMLTKIKEEKCTLKKNYLLFVPNMTHFVKGEEIVYIDVEHLNLLSIPFIKCFYPPKELIEQPTYKKLEKTNLHIDEISLQYLNLLHK